MNVVHQELLPATTPSAAVITACPRPLSSAPPSSSVEAVPILVTFVGLRCRIFAMTRHAPPSNTADKDPATTSSTSYSSSFVPCSSASADLVFLFEDWLGYAVPHAAAATQGAIVALSDDDEVLVLTVDLQRRRVFRRFVAALTTTTSVASDNASTAAAVQCTAKPPRRSPAPQLCTDPHSGGAFAVAHVHEGYVHVINVRLILTAQVTAAFEGAVRRAHLSKHVPLGLAPASHDSNVLIPLFSRAFITAPAAAAVTGNSISANAGNTRDGTGATSTGGVADNTPAAAAASGAAADHAFFRLSHSAAASNAVTGTSQDVTLLRAVDISLSDRVAGASYRIAGIPLAVAYLPRLQVTCVVTNRAVVLLPAVSGGLAGAQTTTFSHGIDDLLTTRTGVAAVIDCSDPSTSHAVSSTSSAFTGSSSWLSKLSSAASASNTAAAAEQAKNEEWKREKEQQNTRHRHTNYTNSSLGEVWEEQGGGGDRTPASPSSPSRQRRRMSVLVVLDDGRYVHVHLDSSFSDCSSFSTVLNLETDVFPTPTISPCDGNDGNKTNTSVITKEASSDTTTAVVATASPSSSHSHSPPAPTAAVATPIVRWCGVGSAYAMPFGLVCGIDVNTGAVYVMEPARVHRAASTTLRGVGSPPPTGGGADDGDSSSCSQVVGVVATKPPLVVAAIDGSTGICGGSANMTSVDADPYEALTRQPRGIVTGVVAAVPAVSGGGGGSTVSAAPHYLTTTTTAATSTKATTAQHVHSNKEKETRHSGQEEMSSEEEHHSSLTSTGGDSTRLVTMRVAGVASIPTVLGGADVGPVLGGALVARSRTQRRRITTKETNDNSRHNTSLSVAAVEAVPTLFTLNVNAALGDMLVATASGYLRRLRYVCNTDVSGALPLLLSSASSLTPSSLPSPPVENGCPQQQQPLSQLLPASTIVTTTPSIATIQLHLLPTAATTSTITFTSAQRRGEVDKIAVHRRRSIRGIIVASTGGPSSHGAGDAAGTFFYEYTAASTNNENDDDHTPNKNNTNGDEDDETITALVGGTTVAAGGAQRVGFVTTEATIAFHVFESTRSSLPDSTCGSSSSSSNNNQRGSQSTKRAQIYCKAVQVTPTAIYWFEEQAEQQQPSSSHMPSPSSSSSVWVLYHAVTVSVVHAAISSHGGGLVAVVSSRSLSQSSSPPLKQQQVHLFPREVLSDPSDLSEITARSGWDSSSSSSASSLLSWEQYRSTVSRCGIVVPLSASADVSAITAVRGLQTSNNGNSSGSLEASSSASFLLTLWPEEPIKNYNNSASTGDNNVAAALVQLHVAPAQLFGRHHGGVPQQQQGKEEGREEEEEEDASQQLVHCLFAHAEASLSDPDPSGTTISSGSRGGSRMLYWEGKEEEEGRGHAAATHDNKAATQHYSTMDTLPIVLVRQPLFTLSRCPMVEGTAGATTSGPVHQALSTADIVFRHLLPIPHHLHPTTDDDGVRWVIATTAAGTVYACQLCLLPPPPPQSSSVPTCQQLLRLVEGIDPVVGVAIAAAPTTSTTSTSSTCSTSVTTVTLAVTAGDSLLHLTVALRSTGTTTSSVAKKEDEVVVHHRLELLTTRRFALPAPAAQIASYAGPQAATSSEHRAVTARVTALCHLAPSYTLSSSTPLCKNHCREEEDVKGGGRRSWDSARRLWQAYTRRPRLLVASAPSFSPSSTTPPSPALLLVCDLRASYRPVVCEELSLGLAITHICPTGPQPSAHPQHCSVAFAITEEPCYEGTVFAVSLVGLRRGPLAARALSRIDRRLLPPTFVPSALVTIAASPHVRTTAHLSMAQDQTAPLTNATAAAPSQNKKAATATTTESGQKDSSSSSPPLGQQQALTLLMQTMGDVGFVGGCDVATGAGHVYAVRSAPLTIPAAPAAQLTGPVNDMAFTVADHAHALVVATHFDISVFRIGANGSVVSLEVLAALRIDTPVLSLAAALSVVAACSAGVVTYYEWCSGGLRERAVELLPGTTTTAIAGSAGTVFKADLRRNLFVTNIAEKSAKVAKTDDITDRYAVPLVACVRLASPATHATVIPGYHSLAPVMDHTGHSGHVTTATASANTTLTRDAVISAATGGSNDKKKPIDPNPPIARPFRMNLNTAYEPFSALTPIGDRLLLGLADGSLRQVTRIPADPHRFLLQLEQRLENYLDGRRLRDDSGCSALAAAAAAAAVKEDDNTDETKIKSDAPPTSYPPPVSNWCIRDSKNCVSDARTQLRAARFIDMDLLQQTYHDDTCLSDAHRRVLCEKLLQPECNDLITPATVSAILLNCARLV